jgi:hypothetical protein
MVILPIAAVAAVEFLERPRQAPSDKRLGFYVDDAPPALTGDQTDDSRGE